MNERQVRCLLRAALGFLVAKQNLAGAFNNGRKATASRAKTNSKPNRAQCTKAVSRADGGKADNL